SPQDPLDDRILPNLSPSDRQFLPPGGRCREIRRPATFTTVIPASFSISAASSDCFYCCHRPTFTAFRLRWHPNTGHGYPTPDAGGSVISRGLHHTVACRRPRARRPPDAAAQPHRRRRGRTTTCDGTWSRRVLPRTAAFSWIRAVPRPPERGFLPCRTSGAPRPSGASCAARYAVSPTGHGDG
ncbi:hypothetical protein HK405_009231, partial [Cladochytrium tenue]